MRLPRIVRWTINIVKYGVLGFVGLSAAGVAALVILTPVESTAERRCSVSDRYQAAQEAVRGHLNRPGTASFPLLGFGKNDNAVWAEFTAENGFGVRQNLRFHATVVCVEGSPVVRNVSVEGA